MKKFNMNYILNKIEIFFWKIAKRIIRKSYGYNENKDDRLSFGSELKCSECMASDVQDWIDSHIELLDRFM
jgi:hypothetical protein